ncbi:anion permease [Escherichia coli]
MNKKSLWKLILILAIPCIIGFMPAPAGLSELAWCFLVFTWRLLWGWLSSLSRNLSYC